MGAEKLRSHQKGLAKKTQPKIFIISGPGGAGKTTLLKQLFQQKKIQDIFLRGITVTTRKKRSRETDGQDYFFVNEEEFLRLEKKKFFLESQRILDNYYGTPKLFYTLAKVKQKDLILCLDVKGGMYLKRKYKPGKIITIFIAAPTKKELCRRLRKRSEKKTVVQQRVKLAIKELRCSKYYDFVITNRSIKSSLKRLKEILLNYQKSLVNVKEVGGECKK